MCKYFSVGVLLFSSVCPAQEPPLRVKNPPAYPGKPAASNAAELKQLFSEAVSAQQKGDLATAVAKYELFLEKRPDFVHAWSNLGAALTGQGRFEEAIPKYERALQLEPQNNAIRINLALAHYKQANFAKAIQEFERVRTADPANRQALYLLADSHLRLGEEKKVIELLGPLEESSEDDRTVSYLLGTALLRDGQTARGQKVIERFMRYGDTAEIHMLIGASQLAAGDYSVALTTIRKAVELDPKLPGVWSLYGRVQMENDLPEEAKASFRKELEANPTDFEANLNLGALLRVETRFDEARPFVERALQMRPNSVAARYQMASIHLAQDRADQAREILETVVKDAPEFVEGHIQLAAAYYRLGRREDGQREREIIMKLQAENRSKPESAPPDPE